MSTTLGIVELPSRETNPSNRLSTLPHRRMGGTSLLEWTVRRVTDAVQLDQVVVLCDSIQQADCASLLPPDVPVFTCPHAADPLGRFAACVDQHRTTGVVRVGLGNCFIDPELLDRLITSARANPVCDYVSYCSADGRPALHATIGVFAEWVKASAVRRADREAVSVEDRQDATRYVYAHPERFRLRFIPAPPPFDRGDVRLTVQVDEDWDHVQTIVDALGTEGVDWQRLATLLDRQPALRRRMGKLNRAERAS
jgi:spore coat polysaccharide biosynthesis protein SpsF